LKPRRGWHLFGTDIVEQPFGQEPMYLQRCKALAQAGIETPTPEFRLNWEADTARQLGLHDAHRQGYIHLSPFARGIHKEMPLPQLAELLTRLHQWSPETRLAISCASNARERRALDELLAALPFQPWKIFSGTLDIPQLCALIQHAALHLSGDTGSMHLAWLLGTPSVSWFLRTGSTRQWAPVGAQHANVAVDVAQPPALWIDAIAAQAMRLLDPTEPIRPRTRRAGTFNKTPLPALPALPEYSFGK
jgi:ADP-heptose:LPS heptosyltransferase